MTDLKCIRCGALSVGNQICKLCEIELNPIRPSASPVIFPSYQPRYVSDNPDTIIRPFNGVGDVVGPTISLFTKHFWLITKIVVVIVAPFEIFRSLSIRDTEYEWGLAAGIYILDLTCSVLVAPALFYALMQVMHTGVAPGVNESYRWGFSKLGKLAVCAVISWTLAGLGLMLCFIPGIIIGLSLSLVFPIAILEKGSPGQILRSSHELTKGHRWNILGATIVIWLLMAVVSLPFEFGGEYLVAGDFALWPLHAAAAIFADIIQQAVPVLSLVIYLSIRALWSQSTQ